MPRPLVLFGGAALLFTLILALAIHPSGASAGSAIGALVRGSVGSWDAIASATLVRAVPLILTGLAVALAFRAGVWNIGADGQLLAGAAVATLVALALVPVLGRATPFAALVAGAAAGGAWAAIAALLRRYFGVLEVISTIMLNFVALYLVGYLVRGPLQEPTHIYPQSATLPELARLPRLIPATRLHIGLLVAVIAAVACWWIVAHFAAGFRLRAVGANPNAAGIAGRIDVARTTARTFVASGALAGLAGAIEVTGVTFALYDNISPGYGYTAIAVALLARLNPLGVLGTGVLFGALEAGALAMQREAAVPSVVVSIVEGMLVLFALALAATAAPGASGWRSRLRPGVVSHE